MARVNATLHTAAEVWRKHVLALPGGAHGERMPPPAAMLVAEFLELGRRDAVAEARWDGWAPGVAWDLSKITPLPPELQSRCEPAAPTATFASQCRAPASP